MSVSQLETGAAVEEAILFPKLPEFIQKKFGVPRPHMATLHRWRQAGARGQVLSTFVLGGRRYVRPSDVLDFMARLNNPSK